MKTILTKKIDGYTIVTGVDKPVVDPVGTAKAVVDYVAKDIEKAEKDGDLEKIRELMTITPERFRQHEIYFEPKPGEKIISDKKATEILELIKNKQKNSVVAMEGDNLKLVPNNIGAKFWVRANGKWSHQTIKAIGAEIPVGASTILSEADRKEIRDQAEEERIRKMSPAEKLLEMEQHLAGALTEAAIKKSEYEISDEPDSLGKSKHFYQQRAKEIEEKYK
jgi:hypothetical protein